MYDSRRPGGYPDVFICKLKKMLIRPQQALPLAGTIGHFFLIFLNIRHTSIKIKSFTSIKRGHFLYVQAYFKDITLH